MNIINIKLKKFEIYFKAQKYREDLIFIINIIDLRVASKVILKYNKVSSIIEIDRRKRVDKIIKNKFSRSSARDNRTIIRYSLLLFYNIILTRILLLNILNKIYLNYYT